MLTKLLGWRWLPAAIGGLALLAAAVTATIALRQRDAARTLAESRAQTIATLEDRVKADRALIAQRDELIAAQNRGVEALAQAAAQNREVYVRQFAAADQRARRHDDRAAQIMALPSEQLDELASCRASRILLEQELIQ